MSIGTTSSHHFAPPPFYPRADPFQYIRRLFSLSSFPFAPSLTYFFGPTPVSPYLSLFAGIDPPLETFMSSTPPRPAPLLVPTSPEGVSAPRNHSIATLGNKLKRLRLHFYRFRVSGCRHDLIWYNVIL